MENYIKPTFFFDYNTQAIQSIIEEYKGGNLSQKEKAIAIYLKIRDGWKYNPYQFNGSPEGYKASSVATRSEGHCIDKSTLLIACLRALGIPAKIKLAKVRNHIGIEKFVEKFKTEEIAPHGMVELFLNHKWIKVSPAFNKELCNKLNVQVLDFNGENDAVFHAFDNDGGKFMEYIEDYGSFEELPLMRISEIFATHYPTLVAEFLKKGKINF